MEMLIGRQNYHGFSQMLRKRRLFNNVVLSSGNGQKEKVRKVQMLNVEKTQNTYNLH